MYQILYFNSQRRILFGYLKNEYNYQFWNIGKLEKRIKTFNKFQWVLEIWKLQNFQVVKFAKDSEWEKRFTLAKMIYFFRS